MSLRINLVMGYGLTDVQYTNGLLVDRRINYDGWLYADDFTKEDNWSMRGFREFVRNEMFTQKKFGVDYDRTDKSIFLNYCKEPINIYDCIYHDREMGLDNVLLLVPPNMREKWVRSDDALDYYLAALGIFPSRNEPWFKLSDTNFYPYRGFVDSHTGERVQNPYSDMIQDLILAGNGDDTELSSLWKKDLGCATLGDVKARYSQVLPGTLKSFIEYTNLFTDPSVIYQLKPMMYCFWR